MNSQRNCFCLLSGKIVRRIPKSILCLSLEQAQYTQQHREEDRIPPPDSVLLHAAKERLISAPPPRLSSRDEDRISPTDPMLPSSVPSFLPVRGLIFSVRGAGELFFLGGS